MKTHNRFQRLTAGSTLAVAFSLCGALLLSPSAAVAIDPAPPTVPTTSLEITEPTPDATEQSTTDQQTSPAQADVAVDPQPTQAEPNQAEPQTVPPVSQPLPTATETEPNPARDLTGVDTRLSNVVLGVGSTNSERYLVWYTDIAHSTAPVVEVIRYDQLVDAQFPSTGAARYEGDDITSSQAKQGLSRDFEAVSNKTVLRDLAPDTRYSYRIGDGNTWLGQWSFTTEKGSNDWSFFFFGDSQVGAKAGTRGANPIAPSMQADADGWQNTLNVASKQYPGIRTIVSAGDQIESNKKLKESERNSIKNHTEREYLGYTAPKQLKELQHAPTLGNHDWYSGAQDTYVEHWNIPNLDPETMNNWWTQNNMLFLHLNTELNQEDDSAKHDAWMTKVISEQGSKYQHIAVVMHRPLFSAGTTHSVSSTTDRVRRVFGPLLKKHGINILLTGHDHSYARSHPVDNYYPGEFKDGEWKGATGEIHNLGSGENAPKEIYLTGDQFVSIVANSSSGSKFYDIHPTAKHPYAAVTNQDYVPEYTVVDVTQCSLTYRTHRAQAVGTHEVNSIVDEFKVYLPYARPTLEALPNLTITQTEAANLDLTVGVKSTACDTDMYPVVVSGSINTELLNTPQTVEYAIAPGTPWEVKQSRTVTVVADPVASDPEKPAAPVPGTTAPGTTGPGEKTAVPVSNIAAQKPALAKTGSTADSMIFATALAAVLTLLGAATLLRRHQQL